MATFPGAMRRMRFSSTTMDVHQDGQLLGVVFHGTQRCPDVQLQAVFVIFKGIALVGFAWVPWLRTSRQPVWQLAPGRRRLGRLPAFGDGIGNAQKARDTLTDPSFHLSLTLEVDPNFSKARSQEGEHVLPFYSWHAACCLHA